MIEFYRSGRREITCARTRPKRFGQYKCHPVVAVADDTEFAQRLTKRRGGRLLLGNTRLRCFACFLSLLLSLHSGEPDLRILSVGAHGLQFVTQARDFGPCVAQLLLRIQPIAFREFACVLFVLQFLFEPRDFLVGVCGILFRNPTLNENGILVLDLNDVASTSKKVK